MDDIVISSRSLEKHLKHLYSIFCDLTTTRIILQPTKSFLAYLSVHLFGQRVDALGMAIAEAMLAAITQLTFSRSLKDLEAYLGLTQYFKQYIPYYAQVARPLQERKTFLNCLVNVEGNAYGRRYHQPIKKETRTSILR